MDPSRHSETLHTLLALAAVSVLSLSGILIFVFGKRLNRKLPYFAALGAGALLGIAFAHLLPEAIEKTGAGRRLSVLLIAGFLGSFLLERVLSSVFQNRPQESGDFTPAAEFGGIHHSHEHNPASGRPLVVNILVGGAIHSFMDGLAIATGFAVAHSVGLAATIAVLLHEVPHHVADVGVLIYGGLPKLRAVLWNALAGCACLAGGGFVLLLGSHVANLTAFLLPITAANFLYIATAILMPELQKERNGWRSLKQILCLFAGVGLMFGLSEAIRE